MDFWSHTVEVQGLRIRYLRAGSAGPPLLMLHGGGTDSALLSWGSAIGPLSQHNQVYAPDWPGYGESQRPNVRYSLAYYIKFLEDLMPALNLERANLVGVSMGGGVALGFTLDSPRMVDKLVLVDSYGLASTAPSHRLSYLFIKTPLINELTWMVLGRSRVAAKAALQNIFHNPDAVSEALVDEVVAELRKPGAGKSFISFQKNEVGWRGLRTVFTDRLDEITAPTLIIHGAEDRLVPLEAARQAHRRIPNSQLHVMEGCGHWPQREQPETFNRIVSSFLNC